MTTRISLTEPLAELCDRSCARCVRESAGDPCSCAPLDDAIETNPLQIRKRWINLPKPRCERCEFLLLIQAIEHLIPAEDQRDWLEQPNFDLDGRSPNECIGAGGYDPVFKAICLLDPSGPVS
jgi:hypothetical protein